MHCHRAERRADLWALIKGLVAGLCIGGVAIGALSVAGYFYGHALLSMVGR